MEIYWIMWEIILIFCTKKLLHYVEITISLVKGYKIMPKCHFLDFFSIVLFIVLIGTHIQSFKRNFSILFTKSRVLRQILKYGFKL